MVHSFIPIAPEPSDGGNGHDDKTAWPRQPDHLEQCACVVIHVLQYIHEGDDSGDAGGQVYGMESGFHYPPAGRFHTRFGEGKALIVIVDSNYAAAGGHLHRPRAGPHAGVDEQVIGLQLDETIDPVADDVPFAAA